MNTQLCSSPSSLLPVGSVGHSAPHAARGLARGSWTRLTSLAALWLLGLCLVMAPSHGAEYQWVDEPGKQIELRQGDRPVVRYMYEAIDTSSEEARGRTYKPYLHVFSPDGDTLLTKGPGGLFPHHRGIYYGFNGITYGDGLKCDTWHCTGKAHQLNKEILSTSTDEQGGKIEVLIEWHGAKGETFALERRTYDVTHQAGQTTVDFKSVLEPTGDQPIKLDGDPQHAGCQFRAAQEVAENGKEKTYYLRTDGKGKFGETRNWDHKNPERESNQENVNRPWNTLSFEIGGNRYSVQRISHPEVPQPERFSEREYGRFGSYFVTEVTKDQPLEVNYRYIIKGGEMDLAECEANAEAYRD